MDNITSADRMTRIRDRYELPATVTIKISTKGLDQDLLDALRCLLVGNKDELPFDLARYVAWPSHQRAITARAQIFLRNGFLDLVEKSSNDDVPRRGATRASSQIDRDGFPADPRVQI